MSKQLSSSAYLRFAFVHIFISSLAFILIGFLYAKSVQLEDVMVHLNSNEYDRSKKIQKILSNCSQLIIDYPESDIFLHIKLCENYSFALKLGKLVATLLILYYSYLLNVFYGSILVPTIMMGLMSTFIFYFTNDQWTMTVSQAILVLMGVVIIVGHCLLPKLDEYLKKQWSECQCWLFKDTSNRLRENTHHKDGQNEDQ
ncbi:unnamed protein product [Rotaria magnacalcarata]|uniref:Uncharacterized protein n=1 Tax=Rotaria magnacalcarata TaxID=392030 RepID=A0A815U2T1_9BILA|nr:unnamed protein product [Rotaria magnacalcarata]CAF1515153.1 unnamed protein product [Rotaria magnacalcarata]CAF4121903.1 unnamed protein product [Rotaria magnacalcarata]CAF4135020.1 unnamed protein product [Rotaria magnacalcarata]